MAERFKGWAYMKLVDLEVWLLRRSEPGCFGLHGEVYVAAPAPFKKQPWHALRMPVSWLTQRLEGRPEVEGFWMKVDDMDVHINGDPNPSPEAREALEQLARAAHRLMDQEGDRG